MAFHRNNNGNNNRYNNNRQNFRPRHNNGSQHTQQGGQRRHVNRVNHVFESNGPDGRVRGTAQQLVEKYVGLARDAHAGGDPVLMLNYYQHAEHYQRVYAEILEENGTAEREREAQRTQYNQQPNVDGDANFAPDTMNPNMGQQTGQQQQSDPGSFGNPATPQQQAPRQDRDQHHRDTQSYQPQSRDNGSYQQQQTQQPPSAPQQPIDTGNGPVDAPSSGSMSTGGRVLGRRPAAPRADGRNQNQGSQLQDDHMPSFLKKDIPIKQAAPPAVKTPAAAKAPAAAKPVATKPAVVAAADTGDAEPVAAAFGKRRAPARRTTATDTTSET